MVLLEHTLPYALDHRAGPRNAPARDTQPTTAGAATPGAVNLAGALSATGLLAAGLHEAFGEDLFSAVECRHGPQMTALL
jgi:hypothetical protein